MRIDEVFVMEYDMFGWLAPGGKVILATPAMAKAPGEYIHTTVAQELLGFGTYSEAFKNGYVRWLAEGGELMLENTVMPANDEGIINTVKKGIESIEKIAKTPAKFKHFDGWNAQQQKPMFFHSYEYTGGARFTDPSYFLQESARALIQRMEAAKTISK